MDAPEEHKANQAPAAAPAEQPKNVQYIVTEQSLNGLGGWLIFWLVIFGLAGLGEISGFASTLVGADNPLKVVNLIFMPVLAIVNIASAVLIALQKEIGRKVAIGTLGLNALWSTITIIVSATSAGVDSQGMPGVVTGVIAAWVFAGLLSLYFFVSKRVKATLVK